MTADSDGASLPEVTTVDEFEDAVAAVVRSAVENGVEVRGSWLVDGVTDGGHDVEGVTDGGYDVEVVAVAPRHRVDGHSPTAAVVEAVAAREEVTETELPPLANAVDPDALAAVVDGDDDRRLSFEYHGYTVTVHPDGSVSLGE